MKHLETHKKDIDMLDLEVGDIRNLLEHVLGNNVFEFGNTQFRQTTGIATGNNFAPPLAVLFMADLEEKAINTYERKPEMYRRYIDDCIMKWHHGPDELQNFIQHLNSIHPRIKFTMEHSDMTNNNTINFLDLSISIKSNRLHWELFVKPIHSGVHLSFVSSHPLACKRSVARSQFKRAKEYATTLEGQRRGEEKIEELLRLNEYPQEEIARARGKTGRNGKTTTKEKKKKESPISGLKLPFIDDGLSRDVSRIVRKSKLDVRVVFSSGPSLKDMLVRSRFSPVVYPRDEQRGKSKEDKRTSHDLSWL